MAVFVDLEDDDVDPPQQGQNGVKTLWTGAVPWDATHVTENGNDYRAPSESNDREEAAHEPTVEDNHSMTVALGCYPIVSAVATHLDLNDVDSLSRTCRGVRDALLSNRSILLKSTAHCVNEDDPVDPDSTLRYRARAGNWYYMEDTSRGPYNGKSGSCARDMVSGCRKCGTIVCRNCAIKPPAPINLRDRHRRLCIPCQKSPLGRLVKPSQGPNISLASNTMKRAICTCSTAAGVWLCQPCGRGIRGADSEYRGIWKWRTQYGEVLGGLGTGIGDADRGVECARKSDCCSSKYIEHGTDCDAEDAREAEDLAASRGHSTSGPSHTPTLGLHSGSRTLAHSSHSSLSGIQSNSSTPGSVAASTRTSSPALGPGYARHEIEGIGNKIKTVKLTMVRVGGCVPEWEDETVQSLRRETYGQVRSWCGWCSRVIPGKKDYESDEKRRASSRGQISA